MFRVIDNLKGSLPPIDSRSPRDIESDIDDEIAFHLEMKTRDLVSAGVEPLAARGFAQQQFGDIHTIKTKCKRIALKERIMLQRVNFVMMIIVVGLVLALSYQIWTTQEKTAEALGVITSEIEHFRRSDERMMSTTVEFPGQIYLDGSVARPGTYVLPQFGSLSLKRLIASGGGLKQDGPIRVTVSQINRQGKSLIRFTTDRLFDDSETDYILAPNDHVLVESLASKAGRERVPRSGEWREITDAGAINEQGAKLLLLAGTDPRNARNVSTAISQLAARELEVGLTFQSDDDGTLVVYERGSGPPRVTRCRWWQEGDDIMLDLSKARPSMTSPVRIRWVGAADDMIDKLVNAFETSPDLAVEGKSNAVTTNPALSHMSAEEQRLRAETLSRFLQQVLTSSNTTQNLAGDKGVRELLDHASEQVESDFANDAQTQVKLRELVQKARASLDERERELRDDRDDEARDRQKRSPFELVAWDDWTPYVRLQNSWWRVESIDGVKVDDVIVHCRKVHKSIERKRFSEDLVQVLGEMGHELKDTAKLGLQDIKTGAPMIVDAAPVTSENRSQIWTLNVATERRAAGEYPRFDPIKGTGPELPANDNRPPNQPLTSEQAHRDVDQLRQHLLDQFSYLKLNDLNLELEIEAVKAEFNGPISQSDFALRIHKLICKFGDGHAGVRGLERMLPAGHTPFLIGDVGDRLIAFREDRTALIDADHPYIRSIDGQPIERWLELAISITARGSPQLQRGRAIRHLRLINFLRREANLPAKPTIDLELESPDGASVRTLSLPVASSKPIYGEWPRTQSHLLENNIGYLRIARMDGDAAAHAVHMMGEFRKTSGLIIDVRGNGGGSREALQTLFPYFMPPDAEPIVANVAAYRLSETFPPDHLAARDLFPLGDVRWTVSERQAIERTAGTFEPQWTPPQNEFSDWHYFVLNRLVNDHALYYYDRPVVILMNEDCFSATDIFLGAFKTAVFPNVKLLGTPSGGGSGRKQSVRLNNSGLRIELSSMISFLPNGEMYDRNGIQPDVIVKPGLSDFVGMSDAQLDAAVRLIRQ